jgi:hypothetical protein
MGTIETALINHIGHVQSSFGVSDEEFARLLSVNKRSIDRWRLGQCLPKRETLAQIDRLDSLCKNIAAMFPTAEGQRAWLTMNMAFLGGLSPLEALQAGRIDRVEAAIDYMSGEIYL